MTLDDLATLGVPVTGVAGIGALMWKLALPHVERLISQALTEHAKTVQHGGGASAEEVQRLRDDVTELRSEIAELRGQAGPMLVLMQAVAEQMRGAR